LTEVEASVLIKFSKNPSIDTITAVNASKVCQEMNILEMKLESKGLTPLTSGKPIYNCFFGTTLYWRIDGSGARRKRSVFN